MTVRRYHPAVLSDLGHSGLIAEVLSADIATPVSAVSGLGAGCRSRRVSGKRMRLDQLCFAAAVETYGVIRVIAEEYAVISAIIGRKSACEYNRIRAGGNSCAFNSNAFCSTCQLTINSNYCAVQQIHNAIDALAVSQIYISIGVFLYLRITGDI